MSESRDRVIRRAIGGSAMAVVAAGLVGIAVGPARADTGAPRAVSQPVDGVAVGVVGNHLVDAGGHVLRLVGVDRSGTEYACVQGWGMADGPTDAASVAAIASWHVNAVRVPLNEDCWLGINGVAPGYSGAAYQSFIAGYVHELNQAGITAILDLHWSAPGTQLATGQQEMPDATHAGAFWSSVASRFAATPGVVFDLYNEPHDVSWGCWLNGCITPAGWAAVGMQSLVDTVRSTGARQPIMVEPLGWGGDLSGWLAYEPQDPDHALVASLHLYNPSGCNTESCWQGVIAPVAAAVPVVTGELGEYDCSSSFVDGYANWADANGVSYLGWTWDAGGGWSCSNGPAMIQDYAGIPNAFGAGFELHLASLAGVTTSAAVVQSWGNGGIVDLTLTNTGTQPVGSDDQPWIVRFAVPPGETVSSMWNAVLGGDGDDVVTASAPLYTRSLAPGQSVTVGYVTGGGAPALPTQIEVDGAPTGP